MLSLPESTKVNLPLPKTRVFELFELKAAQKDRFDRDISRMTIIHELSPATLLLPGSPDSTFFVVQVLLKQPDYDSKNIELIARLIKQNLLLLLEFGGKARLAVWRKRLYQSPWQDKEGIILPLKRLDLDAVWEQLVAQVADLPLQPGSSLDEQLEAQARREALKKQIAKLEVQAWKEVQPRKKFELAKEVQGLKKEMEAT